MSSMQTLINAVVVYEEAKRAAIAECQRATEAARANYHKAMETAKAALDGASMTAHLGGGSPSEIKGLFAAPFREIPIVYDKQLSEAMARNADFQRARSANNIRRED